jgi:dTDP-glucose 4,6-dehydratase/UDP-glucuronate decarboxylase
MTDVKNGRAVGIVEEDVRDVCKRAGNHLESLSGSTLLVAGGGGFLPSYILDAVVYANDHLLSRPCQLVCVDNFITGLPERVAHLEIRPDVHFIRHDITTPLSIDQGIDYIIHAASIASPPLYRKYPLQTIDVNVLGTRNLLDLSRQKGVRGFLYLSSSEVYGDPSADAIPTPESYLGNVSCTGPRACYDESKRLAETLCMVYHREFGIPVNIVRPFNVYGPRLRLDDGRVIQDFLNDALNGRPITLYSDGMATRSFCYISDAVTAMLLLLLSNYRGDAFNVGNDEEVTIGVVAQRINDLFDGKPGISFARSGDVHYLSDNPQRRCPDLNKVKHAIPWKPVVSLRPGLQRTVQWHLEHSRA